MKEKLNQEYDTKISEQERIIDALNKQRRMREESDGECLDTAIFLFLSTLLLYRFSSSRFAYVVCLHTCAFVYVSKLI